MYKKILVAGILYVFIGFNRSYAADQLTITTYYPSPYGSYNELTTNRMAVGDVNKDGTINSLDLPAKDGSIAVLGSIESHEFPVSFTQADSEGNKGWTLGADQIGAGETSYINVVYPKGDRVLFRAGRDTAEIYGKNIYMGRSDEDRVCISDPKGTCHQVAKLYVYTDDYATSGNYSGIIGQGSSYGVAGLNTGSGTGVYGSGPSVGLWGVNGGSAQGEMPNPKDKSVTYGVLGQSKFVGVGGEGDSFGVLGYGGTYGIWGSGTTGVAGTGTSYGVSASSINGSAIYGESSKGYAGEFAGKVKINGSLEIGSGGSIIGADIAESVECPGCAIADVVVIDPQNNLKFKKSTQAYDTAVAGIISEKPTLDLNKSDTKNYQPLALAGLVKCKANVEGGPIKRGDLLVTSSQPGYAMRADLDKVKPGMLIGKALEPLEKGEGRIKVLISGG